MWFDFFPFYSTLLIGNTKKAKELGQNISFWCHYYNSRGLYVQFCLLLFGKGFFYCQKSFSLEGFQKTEKAPHHSVIKLPNFRCIYQNKNGIENWKRGARALHSFLLPQKHQCCLSCMPLFVFPLSYCIKCQALKMEVEIRDAAADLKAYKYRRRSSFPYPKRVKKGSLPLLLYTTTWIAFWE